jgi:hypothetical protein
VKSAADLKTAAANVTTNLSSTLTTTLFGTSSKVNSNLVNGGTADNCAEIMKGITKDATITYTSAQ